MREIKFRAFDDGRMIYPTHALSDIRRFFRVIRSDAVLMQFTGMKDKNGKEIYEGDIIQDCLTKMIMVVRFGRSWKHGFNGWFCENEELGHITTINGDYDTNENSQIEIIGNLFEISNLLTP
jgi:uncharacterized phage protein (TIGR01671 family)